MAIGVPEMLGDPGPLSISKREFQHGRRSEIIKMAITLSVFCDRDKHLDSMTIGLVRDFRGTRLLINFEEKN